MRRWGLYLFLLLHLCSTAYPRDGIVILNNGKQYAGAITLARNPYFWDIFRSRYVSLPLDQIYRISMVEESMKFSKNAIVTHRNYLMGITTWNGVCHWGRWDCRVKVREKKKIHKFILAHTKAIEEESHIKDIIFNPPVGVSKPDTRSILSLSGKIKPVSLFEHVYAMHHSGIIFTGQIVPHQESYHIDELLPGAYDLVWVGKNVILFCFSMPLRASILDKTLESAPDLEKWIERELFEDRHSRKVLYFLGRSSDTRAIVMEEIGGSDNLTGGIRLFWLYLCCYKHNQWNLKKIHLLYHQNLTEPMPKFWLDPQLANILVPLDGGARIYDCIWH